MRVRDLSLTALCALESVDRTGGLKAASIDQGISMPAVSTSIVRLERELGISLLEPGKLDHRRKVLTPQGKALAQAVRDFLPALRRMLDGIKP